MLIGYEPVNTLKYHLQGNRYGKLVVTTYEGRGRWFVQCDCGRVTSADSNNLRTGKVRSCGCSKAQRRDWTAAEVGELMDRVEDILTRALPTTPRPLALEFERLLQDIQEMGK